MCLELVLLIPRGECYKRREGNYVSEVRLKENESLDSALKDLKAVRKAGVLAEVRKREHYEKPSVKRKKSEAARKRKHK